MRVLIAAVAATVLLAPATAEAKRGGSLAAKPVATTSAKPGAAPATKATTGTAAKSDAQPAQARPLLTPAAAEAAAQANKSRGTGLVFIAPGGGGSAPAKPPEKKAELPELRGSSVPAPAPQAFPQVATPSTGLPVPVLGRRAQMTTSVGLPGFDVLN
jgi:hypothetical protein